MKLKASYCTNLLIWRPVMTWETNWREPWHTKFYYHDLVNKYINHAMSSHSSHLNIGWMANYSCALKISETLTCGPIVVSIIWKLLPFLKVFDKPQKGKCPCKYLFHVPWKEISNNMETNCLFHDRGNLSLNMTLNDKH